MSSGFKVVFAAFLALLALGASAQSSSAQSISIEDLNFEPAADAFDWTGTGPGYTDSVGMLGYQSNAIAGPFTQFDECGPLMFHSCALFSGKAPLIHADSSATFNNTDFDRWTYTVPGGPDSYIDTASSQVANVTGESIFDLPDGPPIALTGIWDGVTLEAGAWTEETEELKMPTAEGGPGVTEAFAGMISVEDVPVPYDHWAGWQKLNVLLGDDVPPTAVIDEDDIPDGWIDENSTFDVGLEAEDDGLGLRDALVTGWERDPSDPWASSPDSSEAFGWLNRCEGNSTDPCPGSTPPGFAPTVEAANLPEGHSPIGYLVSDAGPNFITDDAVDVSVDTIDPAIDLGGSFMSAPGNVLDGPSYTLDVDATDGEPGKENSGVVSLEVLIDNVAIDSDSQSCPVENCSLDLSPTIVSDNYSNGPHQLKVKATDAVGHVKTTVVNFEVDR